MKKIILGVTPCQAFRYNCYIVALESILRFYGYEIGDVLFDHWRFIYRKPNGKGFAISARARSFEESLGRHGILVRHRKADDFEKAWAQVRIQIEADKPTPTLMDVYYLDYYAHPFGHPDHDPHYVILTGWDDDSDTVHFVDPYPAQTFEGDISFHAFRMSWNSDLFGDRRNGWIEFEVPAKPISCDAVTIRRILNENIHWMLSENQRHDFIVGIKGIRAFAEDLMAWEEEEDAVVKMKMKKTFDYFESVVDERVGHSEFLTSAGRALELESLNEVDVQVEHIAQSWLVVRNMFFKGSRKDPLVMLPRIQNRLLDIADREEQVLIALREAIKT